MSQSLPSFRVGSLYSNEDVYRSLEVGNAGGIRTKARADGGTQRMVIMTSLPDAKSLVENPYHDRVEGNVLVYTAAGRIGDQTVTGQNAKIARQSAELFPIWAFQLQTSRRDRSTGPKRWKFLGLLQYLRSYAETQHDSAGSRRSAFVFELYIYDRVEEVAVTLDAATLAMLIDENPVEPRIEDTDREVELTASQCVRESLADSEALEGIRSRLLVQEPQKFETTISELLVRSGFRDVQVTRYSQDGGIDINARPGESSWPMAHLLVQVQAKRWMHTVGRREVAELRGSILPHSAGCIVTTSHFSRAAISESTSPGKVPISLINGRELARLLKTNGATV